MSIFAQDIGYAHALADHLDMTEPLARSYIVLVLLNTLGKLRGGTIGIERHEYVADAILDQVSSLPEHVAFIEAVKKVGQKFASGEDQSDAIAVFKQLLAGFDRHVTEDELTARHLISLVVTSQMDLIATGETDLDRFDALIETFAEEGFLDNHPKFFASVRELARKVDAQEEDADDQPLPPGF